MPERPAAPPSFRIVLRDVGGSGWRSPAEVRLRQALKVLLRQFGLRCESVEPHSESDDASESPESSESSSRASSG